MTRRRRLRLAIGPAVLGGALIWLGWSFAKVGWAAADQRSSVLGGFLGLGGLLLTVYEIRLSLKQQLPLSMQSLADHLAERVEGEWNAEVRVRELNGAPFLSVSWKPDMTPQQWGELLAVAPGPIDSPAGSSYDLQELAGETHQIAEVLNRVPTRQLVLLGERGAGKTTLLIRLLLDLLEKREPGTAVPVFLSLSSWDPQKNDLNSWIASELERDHPLLRFTDRQRNSRTEHYSRARALLDLGKVIPLLDGFDELPSDLYVHAMKEIGRSPLPKRPLVLVSRAAEYERALHAAGEFTPLPGAVRIRLQPIDIEESVKYLNFGVAPGRWTPVTDQLSTDGPLARALRTPLCLALARSVYMPRGSQAPEPAPSELSNTQRFSTEGDIAAHLFEGYITTVYDRSADFPRRWTGSQARWTLSFIARKLQAEGAGEIAWWQMRHWCNALIPGLMVGPIIGLGAGVAFGIPALLGLLREIGYDPSISEALRLGIPTAFLVTLAAILLSGLTSLRDLPGNAVQWSPVKFSGLVSAGVLLGMALDILEIAPAGPVIIIGLALFAPSFIYRGVTTRDANLRTAVGPAPLLKRDRQAFLVIFSTVSAVSGLPLAILFAVTGEMEVGLYLGSILGVLTGLRVGLKTTAWLPFLAVRCYFALRGQAPWKLMEFLADAHRKGILRQVGGIYEFRHIDLQHHLAERPNP